MKAKTNIELDMCNDCWDGYIAEMEEELESQVCADCFAVFQHFRFDPQLMRAKADELENAAREVLGRLADEVCQ